MNSKTFRIICLIFFGELLIITGILHFSHFIPRDITYINIVVSSFIFLVFMSPLISPGNYFSVRSQKVFAGMGIMGLSLMIYSVVSLWLMFSMNGLIAVSFITQLFVHAGLLFLLGLSLFFSVMATDKAGSVNDMIVNHLAELEKLRSIAAVTAEKVSRSAIAQSEKVRIQSVLDNIRYIRPSGTPEAVHLECNLLEVINRLDNILSVTAPDSEHLKESVLNLELLFTRRKQIYSHQ